MPDGRPAASAGGTDAWVPIAIVTLVLALGVAGLFLTRPLRDLDAAIAELERAFGRTGRPLPAGMTLSELEHRLRTSPEAATYVQRLRLNRFGAGQRMPSTAQRRALRRYLAGGLGPVRWLRAMWALPPRRRGPLAGAHGSPSLGLTTPRGA